MAPDRMLRVSKKILFWPREGPDKEFFYRPEGEKKIPGPLAGPKKLFSRNAKHGVRGHAPKNRFLKKKIY